MQEFKRVLSFVSLILVVIMLFGSGFGKLFIRPATPANLPVAKVTGTLAVQPEVHYNYHTRSPNIRITLNEYPNRFFNIADEAFNALKYQPTQDNIAAGDTLFMEVAAKDYTNNILQQNEPRSLLSVTVFAFHAKKHIFLTLDDYCKEVNSDRWIGYVLIAFGTVIVIALYFELRRRKKIQPTERDQV